MSFTNFDQDSKSRLLRNVYGEVSEERSKALVAGLYYFRDTLELIEEEVDSEEESKKPNYKNLLIFPIDFIVSTEGGSVTDMFALYDCLREVTKGL